MRPPEDKENNLTMPKKNQVKERISHRRAALGRLRARRQRMKLHQEHEVRLADRRLRVRNASAHIEAALKRRGFAASDKTLRGLARKAINAARRKAVGRR